MDEKKLKEFLEETYLIDFNEISADDNLFTGGYIDSFGYVELVQFIEENYQIEISNEELTSDALISLNNMISFIISKQKA